MTASIQRRAAVTTIAACVAGAGCGAAAEEREAITVVAPRTTTQISTTRRATKPRVALPRSARIIRDGEPCPQARAMVTYQAGDGAWFSHEVAICADGRATFDVSERLPGYRVGEAVVQLAPNDMKRIRHAVEEAGPGPPPPPPPGGADFVSYTVTYGGETLHAYGFAGPEGLPDRSARLVRLLETVVAPIAAEIPTHPPPSEPPPPEVEDDARAALFGCGGGTRAVDNALVRLNELLKGGIAPPEEDEARRHVNTVLNNC